MHFVLTPSIRSGIFKHGCRIEGLTSLSLASCYNNSYHMIFFPSPSQLVDMHAGPGDLATNDHEIAALRLKEITDSHRISQGPFFLVSCIHFVRFREV